MNSRPLNVGLIGLGTVGSQVAERMVSWGPQLSRRAGVELCLKRVLVRDPAKRRSIEISSDLLTSKPSDLLDDPAIEVLIEVAGGDEPIRSYIEQAIRAGKHVITANKVVMARHGPELLDQAAEKNVDEEVAAARILREIAVRGAPADPDVLFEHHPHDRHEAFLVRKERVVFELNVIDAVVVDEHFEMPDHLRRAVPAPQPS